MAVYKIADLNIEITPIYKETEKRLMPFLSKDGTAQFAISVKPEQLQDCTFEDGSPCPKELAEGTVILSELCRRILSDFDGFFFHSSSLMIENEAYIFTAKSGVGKSTHTSLWRQLFKNKVAMINDDKSIIRRKDGRFRIYSTPWMGKSDLGTNTNAPVKAVYVLERAENNSIEKVSVSDVFRELLEATLVPTDRENMSRLMELMDGFFLQVQLFKLYCNTDISAAQLAYDAAQNTR